MSQSPFVDSFHNTRSADTRSLHLRTVCQAIGFLVAVIPIAVIAGPPATPAWSYRPELLRPFWQGDTVEQESLLFIRDAASGTARASLLYEIQDVVRIGNSAGDVIYEEGKDYAWRLGSREITLPAGSRIPSRTPEELRRPAKTQKYELTHRDGNGEIFFGAELEYAAMQTCVSYRHSPSTWELPLPTPALQSLPRSIAKLHAQEPLSIVVLGDSISAGANASGLFNKAPYQPPYPELVRRHLMEHFGAAVKLTNLSVGGMDSAWGLTQIPQVVAAQPDVVLLAFGMNDAAGRSAEEFHNNTRGMIEAIRERLPACEVILVAPMLGNADWVRLKQDLFPAYRDKLLELRGPGVAVADLTTIWQQFLERKRDWDQTGNGVNHPNDFGHRVYAQVITTLLDAR